MEKEQISHKGLSSNQLKIIAIIAMVIDHCTIVFISSESEWALLLRAIGRLTAPIMCFFIAEGYYHTSNLKKYMERLLLIAVISHIPHNLCLGQNVWQFWNATDVMFPLLFGLIALAAYKRERLYVWQKILIVIACCALSYSGDWNYIAVFWILAFGIFHGNRRNQILAFSTVCGLYLLQEALYTNSFPFISRFGVFLVIPLLLSYNGRRGKKNEIIKWGFYWFYPIHFMVIFLITKIAV